MAKKVKRLLELSECCKALNMTKDEILYLVRTRAIPHRVEDDGRLTFTESEILGRIIPKPPKEAMAPPKFDISAMSKDDIMSVFSSILQAKAAEEEKDLKKTAPAEVKGKPAETVHPEEQEKKEEAPTAEPEPETKKDMEIPEEQEKKEEAPTADAGPETVTQEKEEPETEPKEETKPKKETAAKPKK